jgi:hypothetical protein
MKKIFTILLVLTLSAQAIAEESSDVVIKRDLLEWLVIHSEHDKAMVEADLVEVEGERHILPDGRMETIFRLHDQSYRVVLVCGKVESAEKIYGFWQRLKDNALILCAGIICGFVAGLAVGIK